MTCSEHLGTGKGWCFGIFGDGCLVSWKVNCPGRGVHLPVVVSVCSVKQSRASPPSGSCRFLNLCYYTPFGLFDGFVCLEFCL